MGIYTKVVSIVNPIDDIKVSVGGSLKNIESAWIFVNGVRKQVFPTTEEWTLIYENTDPGIYEKELGWGKYRCEIGGAGGSGGAVSQFRGNDESHYATNGSKGYTATAFFEIGFEQSKLVNIFVGAGGSSARAGGATGYTGGWAGNGGTGYKNGLNGNYRSDEGWGNAGSGGGGGSSAVFVDGVVVAEAAGGQGGAAYSVYVGTRTGGVGGNNGGTSGNGVSGGAGVGTGGSGTYTSGAGANGYVRIYISNMKP